ncbi:MAG: hypothetical protein PHC53_05380 [Patescibacteria group bacterium]|nr:hypothetical protein [Patescibacteria group bacterium]
MPEALFNKKVRILQDFSGGWNPKWAVNATQLADNQSPYMVNADFAARFALTKRRGCSLLGNPTAGIGSIKSLMNFRKSDGTEILMRTYSTNVEYLLAGVWTLVTGAGSYTADLLFDSLVYKDTIYFGNGIDNFSYWTGTGAVSTSAGNPKGNIYASAFLRLWIAGQLDTTKLSYSVVDDYSNFGTGSGYMTFPSAIKSITSFITSTGTEQLQVYLSDGTSYEVHWNSATSAFERGRLKSNGAKLHRTTKQVENDNFVLDKAGQIRSQGYEQYLNDIRTNVQSVFLDVYMDTLNNSNACSIYAKKQYLFSSMEPGASANNVILLYDSNYKSWRKYNGLGANDFVEYGGKVCFASSTDLNVYQFDSSAYSDYKGLIDAPIYFEYHTKDLDYDNPMDTKMFRWVKISGFISANCKIPIKMFEGGTLSNPISTKEIRGDGPYVDQSQVYPWGAAQYASIPFAGLGGISSSIEMKPFTVMVSLGVNHTESPKLVFTNYQTDVDFIITHIKFYAEEDAPDRIDKAWIL